MFEHEWAQRTSWLFCCWRGDKDVNDGEVLVFDSKAIDGDGDGIVQEGTEFERPIDK